MPAHFLGLRLMPWVSLKADGPPDPAAAGNIYDYRQVLTESRSMER